MKIGSLLHRNILEGAHFGVEVEVEGCGLPSRVNGFSVVQEGSLRPVNGEDGKEYVFKQPSPIDTTCELIYKLNSVLHKEGSFPEFSNRTSVHVHVNVTDMTVEQWFNFLFLWVLFEEAMLDYCGESRKGNLFCLSSQNAEGFMFTLEEVIRTGVIPILGDEVRYSAVNVAATPKYGSVEFRSMRGTTDPEILIPWISTLSHLRCVAMEYETPQVMLEEVIDNPFRFISKLFQEDHFIWKHDDLERSVLSNAFRCAIVVDGVSFNLFNFTDEPPQDI